MTLAAPLLEQVLSQVAAQLAGGGALPDDELKAHLRSSFPGVHFTVCSDDDIPARVPAVAGNDTCRLYYVDASDHCLRLTDDAAGATGLVVALCDEDNEDQ